MKKKNEKSSKKRIFWAFFLSLLFLYVSTLVLYAGIGFLRVYLDQTIFESAWTKLVYAKTLNDVPLHTIQNLISSVSTSGMLSGIMLVIVLKLYFLTGWILTKTAKSLPWFFSALPVLFISLFALNLTSSGNYSSLGYPLHLFYINDDIKYYVIGIAVLLSLLGGFSQKHLSIRWNK